MEKNTKWNKTKPYIYFMEYTLCDNHLNLIGFDNEIIDDHQIHPKLFGFKPVQIHSDTL